VSQDIETGIVWFVGNVLFYSVSIFISHNQEDTMERWHRAFTKNDTEFKELFGVKKEIFHEIASCRENELPLKTSTPG